MIKSIVAVDFRVKTIPSGTQMESIVGVDFRVETMPTWTSRVAAFTLEWATALIGMRRQAPLHRLMPARMAPGLW